ncbi:uncharacterized protein TNCV_3014201 [Trichonephila clavipes]|nr:uncharacterized protein TNCV_3014201 [Trichonephila clavipes]
MGVNPIFQVTIGFMVLPAGQGPVPHPSIVPECFTINQLWNDWCTWPWGIVYCLNSGNEVCRRVGIIVLRIDNSCEKCWMQVFPSSDSDEVSPVCARIPECSCVSSINLKQTKEVLLEVAIDWGVEVNSTLTKSEIKNRICQSEDYNEESVKSLLEGILKERQEARELKERQETRAYELERLRLSNATETVSVSSADLEGQGAGDKRKVAEDRWVSQLIPLLPIEIAEIVAKEPLEKSDDYPHIKNLLLARFQLTPIALRDRFESHQRRPGAMWADLVFELRSYLDNWLAGMKVGDFAALKELLVTEQIKKSTK